MWFFFIYFQSLFFLGVFFRRLQSPVQVRCGMFGLKKSGCSFSPPSSSPSSSATTSHSTGPCQSFHLSKLTRPLGSPETWHLAHLPTVSPPHITPSLSALTTPLSSAFRYPPLSSPCFFTSRLLLLSALQSRGSTLFSAPLFNFIPLNTAHHLSASHPGGLPSLFHNFHSQFFIYFFPSFLLSSSVPPPPLPPVSNATFFSLTTFQ